MHQRIICLGGPKRIRIYPLQVRLAMQSAMREKEEKEPPKETWRSLQLKRALRYSEKTTVNIVLSFYIDLDVSIDLYRIRQYVRLKVGSPNIIFNSNILWIIKIVTNKA